MNQSNSVMMNNEHEEGKGCAIYFFVAIVAIIVTVVGVLI